MPGRPVVIPRGDGAREPLVVAEVQVRLGAVVGDVDLAVLERAHRARVHVDVGVELLERDPVAVALEQRADRRGGQALAQRRHHAARHEDELDRSAVSVLHESVVSGRRPPRGGAPGRDRPGCRPRPSRATCLDRLDAEAVLQRAQLLERLRLLERRRREPGELEQELAAVDVQADVLQRAPRIQPAVSAPGERDGRAREVQGEALPVPHHLDHIRDWADRRHRQRAAERPHRDRRVGRQRRERLGDHLGRQQRLVPLHVDDELARERRGDLRHAVGTAGDGRPASSSARPPNASTAARTRSSSVATMTASTAGDAAARRYTCSIIGRPPISASGFAGETGRLVSRGDDGDVPCFSERVGVPAVPVRVHGES